MGKRGGQHPGPPVPRAGGPASPPRAKLRPDIQLAEVRSWPGSLAAPPMARTTRRRRWLSRLTSPTPSIARSRRRAAIDGSGDACSGRSSRRSRHGEARRFERPVTRGLTLALAASLGLVVFGSGPSRRQPGGPFYPIKLVDRDRGAAGGRRPAGWVAGSTGSGADRRGARRRGGAGRGRHRRGARRIPPRARRAGRGPLDPARQAQLQARGVGGSARPSSVSTAPSRARAAGLLSCGHAGGHGSTDPNDGNAGPPRRR